MSLEIEDRALLTQTVDMANRLNKNLTETRRALTRKVIRASAAVVIALVAALGSTRVSLQNRSLIHTQARDRTSARAAACDEDNKLIVAIRTSVPSALLAFTPNPDGLTDEQLLLTLRPEQQAVYAGYRGRIERDFPLRDCTTAGIAAYYAPR